MLGTGPRQILWRVVLPAALPNIFTGLRLGLRNSWAGLVVAEMISEYDLTADPAKIREAIEDIASTYQDPEEVINWYYSENQQLAGIESRVLEDAVVERLLSQAAVAEVECSYQDALAKARPAAQA